MYALPADRFFAFADRLIAYRGVIRMRAEEESQRRQPSASTARSSAARSSTARSGGVTYYSDIAQNPDLAQYFGPRRDQPAQPPKEGG
ncbi:hypothetical protein [Actinomadura sp. K4S16]|uniref:hypothetical protein n=1 Tax=Actinomadura sp. K4S16 TaxID=1316147 RepID=UPI0011ED511F|nr:hypothetical protein [Actinomadura sp. K4S16]